MKYAVITLLLLQVGSHQNLKNGLAIGGYDPVSYFGESGPLKGDRQFKTEYKGATYYFTSAENRKIFQSDPSKYAPAYGGWCAYAMGATGEKVKIDPETFKILDNRLYLFYNFWGNNTLKSWNRNEKELKGNADKYWSEIVPTN